MASEPLLVNQTRSSEPGDMPAITAASFFRGFCREKACVCIFEPRGLLRHCGDHVRMAMAEARNSRPSTGIDVPPAGLVDEENALSAHNCWRPCLR